jgi:dipeptidase E
MKMILTSTGLKSGLFRDYFLRSLKNDASEAKVIFVPTAAIDDEAKSKLPGCMEDLLKSGISAENILTYDLDYVMSHEDLAAYDAIYFCGGSTKHLLERINEVGFVPVLRQFLSNGHFFIGVSAGSKICGDNYPGNLGYLHRNIELHAETGSPTGKVSWQGTIFLTDTQAMFVDGDDWEIFDGEAAW